MTEKHHVPTHPGENAPPEIVNIGSVRAEAGTHAQGDDLDPWAVILVIVFGALAIAVLLAALEAFYNKERNAEYTAKFSHPNPVLVDAVDGWNKLLQPHWANPQAGTATMGINEAEIKVIKEMAAKGSPSLKEFSDANNQSP